MSMRSIAKMVMTGIVVTLVACSSSSSRSPDGGTMTQGNVGDGSDGGGGGGIDGGGIGCGGGGSECDCSKVSAGGPNDTPCSVASLGDGALCCVSSDMLTCGCTQFVCLNDPGKSCDCGKGDPKDPKAVATCMPQPEKGCCLSKLGNDCDCETAADLCMNSGATVVPDCTVDRLVKTCAVMFINDPTQVMDCRAY